MRPGPRPSAVGREDPERERTAAGFKPGERHYRAYIGPPERYDLVAGIQFNLLTLLGLRESHSVLDIGCGSLRGGRLLIPYLLPGRYFGIEPNTWLIEEAIRWELGEDLVQLKRPTFSDVADFRLSVFGRQFDFLMAQSIFSHASRNQIRRCLAEAATVMKPTSVFAANFMEGVEDYAGSDWVYPHCVVYTPGLIDSLVSEAGLACRFIDWPHPELRWLLIFHRGHQPKIPVVRGAAEIAALERELEAYRALVMRLRKHPYIRLGLWGQRTLRRLRMPGRPARSAIDEPTDH